MQVPAAQQSPRAAAKCPWSSVLGSELGQVLRPHPAHQGPAGPLPCQQHLPQAAPAQEEGADQPPRWGVSKGGTTPGSRTSWGEPAAVPPRSFLKQVLSPGPR